MARITCPNCGEVIEVDPSQVEDLTRQLRDELFAHDLEARLAEMGHLHDAQVENARAEERGKADHRVAQVQEQLAKLQAQLDAAQREQELAVQREQANAGQELARMQAQLDAAKREQELAVQREHAAATEKLANEQRRAEQQLQAQRQKAQEQAELAQKREAELASELSALKVQLSSQEETLRAQGQAELLKATAELERSKGELESKLQIETAHNEQVQASLREEMARRENELAKHAEERIAQKDSEIARYRDDIERLRNYRMSLSTKLVGESLERHCESEFNRIRLQAYPKATFEKDNEAVEGTKGDFIFRDYDDEGNELLSIMFEMKNEEELSATVNRKRNEDHFKKLDSDRKKKNCEYAVLVSTLEPDNDFYNAGIVDVSWHYPKMFVVRPQCFTTIIGLLKAAALAAHPYRMQLERAKREELDVTTFEEKVSGLVQGIENDYLRAANNYERAEKDIDAIIAKLNDLKKQLGTAAKHFETASKRGEKLTVKRLTWGNATMKAAFAEAAAQREQLAQQAEDGVAEPSDQPGDAVDPDEME